MHFDWFKRIRIYVVYLEKANLLAMSQRKGELKAPSLFRFISGTLHKFCSSLVQFNLLRGEIDLF